MWKERSRYATTGVKMTSKEIRKGNFLKVESVSQSSVTGPSSLMLEVIQRITLQFNHSWIGYSRLPGGSDREARPRTA